MTGTPRVGLDTVPESGGRTYSLLGADRRLYRSAAPGWFGGHRKSRIYGRLDCPAALRAIVGGGYAAHRVFFADEQTAVAAGYRPCAVCLPGSYAAWKARAATRAPRPHTAAELDRLIRMLRASRAETIAIGHGRHTASAGAADALAAAWTAGAARCWPSSTGPPQPHPGCGPRNGWPTASPTHGSWLIPRPDAHNSPAVSPASPAGLPAGRSASPAWPLLISWH